MRLMSAGTLPLQQTLEGWSSAVSSRFLQVYNGFAACFKSTRVTLTYATYALLHLLNPIWKPWKALLASVIRAKNTAPPNSKIQQIVSMIFFNDCRTVREKSYILQFSARFLPNWNQILYLKSEIFPEFHRFSRKCCQIPKMWRNLRRN